MQRYMKSDMPFYGIAAPRVHAVTRDVVAAHPLADRPEWEGAVRRLFDEATHREEWYVAVGVAGHRRYRHLRTPESLELYRHLAAGAAWWDVVDAVASQVGQVLRSHPEDTAGVLRAWSVADDPWLRRVAVLSQLGRRTETDTRLLSELIAPSLTDRGFFLRKAIGWALRDYARTDPDWVRRYVAAHRDQLSPLSVREALKRLGG
jgi:3-methyladenine DNA glycosylase AlkD